MYLLHRLWDAVGGFLFLFSHMQDKLSRNSSQVDLLKELLNLQKDMITMMLSMLEGNVVNGMIFVLYLSLKYNPFYFEGLICLNVVVLIWNNNSFQVQLVNKWWTP